jgi:hypothetical protein
MIEIKNKNNDLLDIAEGQRLGIEIASTLFADGDVLTGSKSLPISAGLSENNRRFLNNQVDYFNTNFDDIAVSVSTFGLVLHQCLLSYRIKNSTIDAFLKIDMGELATSFKNTKIADLIKDHIYLGKTPDQVAAQMKVIAQGDYGTFPVTFFPKIQPTFFDGLTWHPTNVNFDFLNQPYANVYDRTAQKFIVDGTTANQNGLKNIGYPVVPFVYLVFVIKRICKHFNLNATGQWLNETETLRTVIDSSRAVNVSDGNEPNLPPLDTVTYPQYYAIAKQLPDVSVADFFKNLREYYGLGIFVDASMHEVLFKTTKEIVDETEYVEIINGDTTYTINESPPEGIVVEQNTYTEYAKELTDAYLLPVLEPRKFEIGKGQKDKKLKIGTLPTVQLYDLTLNGPGGAGSFGLDLTLPISQDAGILSGNIYKDAKGYVQEPKAATDMKLLFYHGFQPDQQLRPYPSGSSISANNQSAILTKYSLWPAAKDNIFEYYQRPYFDILTNKNGLTISHLLPVSKLVEMRPERKLGIRLNTLTLVKAVLQKLDYELPATDGFVKCRLKALLVGAIDSPVGLAQKYTIWVKLLIQNQQSTTVGNVTTDTAELRLVFWADRFLTQITTVDNLIVKVQFQTYDQNGNYTEVEETIVCNGFFAVLRPSFTLNTFVNNGTGIDFVTNVPVILSTDYYSVI